MEEKIKWQDVEEQVRKIASRIWGKPAFSKVIEGVQIDSYVEKNNDYYCLVEVSKNNTLDKIRTDISKLSSVGFALFSKNIYTEKYIVMTETPTNSMRTTGDAAKVTVMSLSEFENMWFNYDLYVFHRLKQPFGSLVEIETGSIENNVYIPVNYTNTKTGESYTIENIVKKLLQGSRIILKGGFGTGKSRCVKELFERISKLHFEKPLYTVAINLREHWGAKNHKELLRRHLDDLSITSEGLKEVFYDKDMVFLLDGFDEIGSQSWSVDPEKMSSLRANAVRAVKDLIMNTQGGCLITGREHYFNSDEEMLSSFGLNSKNTIILSCAEEFSEQQIKDYLEKTANKQVSYIPQWLPKRPLIMSIAVHNLGELFDVKGAIVNECDFWDNFLTLLAKRESRINPALNEDTIKDIMIRVGRIGRKKDKDFGPISLSELNQAFEDITGERPNEESAIMLHRLPGLGRVDSNSNERMFVDSYIMNGLRAEDVIRSVQKMDKTVYDEKWNCSLNKEGINILSDYIFFDESREKEFLNAALLSSRRVNMFFALDIIMALAKGATYQSIDFRNIILKNVYIPFLDFSNKQIANLDIRGSIIEFLDLTNCDFATVCIEDTTIGRIKGISTKKSLPGGINNNCSVDEFEPVSTVNRIKNANLTRSQTILVTIIKKIFSTVTKGNGRKEEALLRGLGDKGDSKICEKIINKMITDEIITKHKGDEGWIYSPNLKVTSRMVDILSDLTNSKDSLWEFVSNL
ncbi:MAG: hypothetical protein K5753_04705 [Clostridia bacterium]|nr:hypothetical protein [Clostridia bacterium]